MTSLLEQHDDTSHWERPRNFDWARESADFEVPEELRSVIEQLATKRGYALVPAADLEKPYPRGGVTGFTNGTWWIRYFDYL